MKSREYARQLKSLASLFVARGVVQTFGMKFLIVLTALLASTLPLYALDFTRFDESADPMPSSGAYKQDRVENVKGRTLQFLSLEEKRELRIEPEVLAFANFRYQGQFYVAHIPGVHVDAVNHIVTCDALTQSVHVISEHWEAKANPDLASLESHAYLRFDFKPGRGVVLDYNQAFKTRANPKLKPIRSAVLSVEALRSQTQLDAPFIPHAFLFDFAVGHLFYATYDRTQSEMADTARIEEDLPLSFPRIQSAVDGVPDPRDAVLIRAIQSSPRFGRTQSYNFVLNNCTNRLFEILDEALFHHDDFNRPDFVRAISAALRVDLPKAFHALDQAMSLGGSTLPDSLLTGLNTLTSDQLRASLMGGAWLSPSPNTYQSWFPPLVNAHLIARGLLGTSP